MDYVSEHRQRVPVRLARRGLSSCQQAFRILKTMYEHPFLFQISLRANKQNQRQVFLAKKIL